MGMIEKRFTTNGYKIYDTFHDGMHWLVNEVEADEIVTVMNNLDTKARERSKALSKLQKKNEQLESDNKGYVKRYSELFDEYKKNKKENEQLKKEVEELKQALIRSAFDR